MSLPTRCQAARSALPAQQVCQAGRRGLATLFTPQRLGLSQILRALQSAAEVLQPSSFLT